MEGIEKLRMEVIEMNDRNVSAILDYLEKRKDLYDKCMNILAIKLKNKK